MSARGSANGSARGGSAKGSAKGSARGSSKAGSEAGDAAPQGELRGWAYFGDYDEGPQEAEPDEDSHYNRRCLEMLQALKRSTRPGWSHEESLMRTFAQFDTEEDLHLTFQQFLNAMRTAIPARVKFSDDDAELLYNEFLEPGERRLSVHTFIEGMGTYGSVAEEPEDVRAHIIRLLKLKTPGWGGFSHYDSLHTAFSRYDTGADGVLDFEEFFNGLKNYLGRKGEQFGRADARQVFDLFHDPDTGSGSGSGSGSGYGGSFGGSGSGRGGGGRGRQVQLDSIIKGLVRFVEQAEAPADTSLQDLVRKLARKTRPDQTHAQAIVAAFNPFDFSGNGQLSVHEFTQGMQNYLAEGAGGGLPLELLQKMFLCLDSEHGLGEIGIEELANGVFDFDFAPFEKGAAPGGGVGMGMGGMEGMEGGAAGRGGGSRRGSGSAGSQGSRGRPPGTAGSGGRGGAGVGTLVNVDARQVWDTMTAELDAVGHEGLDLGQVERRLLQHARARPGDTLNYATKQRVQMAAQKLLGAALEDEFEGLGLY